MKYALVNNLREEPKKGLKGFCPFCNDEVIPKVGQGRKIPHWAHKNIRNCDLYKGEETAWHRNWKNQYPESFQERIGVLITEVVVKDATIKQLTMQLQQSQEKSDGFDMPTETTKRVK